MNSAEAILTWLKEADILVNERIVDVRAVKGDRQQYQWVTWGEPERAESNPLVPLIYELAELVQK